MHDPDSEFMEEERLSLERFREGALRRVSLVKLVWMMVWETASSAGTANSSFAGGSDGASTLRRERERAGRGLVSLAGWNSSLFDFFMIGMVGWVHVAVQRISTQWSSSARTCME